MKRIVLVMLMFVVAAMNADVTSACSCSGIRQRKAFRKAEAVFIGQALSYIDNPNVKEDGYLVVRFKVEKSWKGAKNQEIIVASEFGHPELCNGFHIEEGKRYLIYAYREGKTLVARTTCDRSTPAQYAAEDVKSLNSFWYRFGARIYPF